MTNDLMAALLAAGIKPSEANRISRAVESIAKNQVQRVYALQSTSGSRALPGGSGDFALYASAPGTNIDSMHGSFGAGGGALGVSGAAVFDGEVYVADELYSTGIQNEGDIKTTGTAIAKSVQTQNIKVLNSASFSPRSIDFNVPLTLSSDLLSRAFAGFSKDVTFLGPMQILGKVNWKGVDCSPVRVEAMNSISPQPGGTGKMVIHSSEITVLSQGAIAPSVMYAKWHGVSSALTGFAKLSTEKIEFVTGVSFDPYSCAITTTTSKAIVLTSETAPVTVWPEINKSLLVYTAGTTSQQGTSEVLVTLEVDR